MAETIFHKIIRKEIPAAIVFESEEIIAFKDISPVAPIHVLIVPKRTISNLAAAEDADTEVLGNLLQTAKKLAKELGVSETGYRVVINCGENGGQTVDQLHVHLIGGRQTVWPPG